MTDELDYRRTSSRPAFDDLPSEVQVGIATVAGSAIEVAHPPVTTGFTGAYAGLLALRDGRRVFAKAAGPLAPFALQAIPREAGILRVLADRVTAPRLVGSVLAGRHTHAVPWAGRRTGWPRWPSLSAVRDHQRQMARTFLALLASRRDWS